jgi:hypothetical protein
MTDPKASPSATDGSGSSNRWSASDPTIRDSKSAQAWERYRPAIERLASAPVNFDLDRRHQYTADNGWNIDSYKAELPDESPGEPEPRGSFELAKEVLTNYEFPDPSILEGFYQPHSDLLNRVMMLRAKFLFLRFEFGVRICEVTDEFIPAGEAETAAHDSAIHRWGYAYQTLEGHWEMGQMTFRIEKAARTGKVTFYINAFSRVGHIPNIFYRIGFWIFGRRIQIKFAKRAMERMQKLVALRLEGQR